MKNRENKNKKRRFGISAFPIIVLCFILALAVYHFIFGNPSNFMNNDPNNHPLPGNLLGTIYKGGVIVPVIQTLLFTVLTLSVERYIALRKTRGRKTYRILYGTSNCCWMTGISKVHVKPVWSKRVLLLM